MWIAISVEFGPGIKFVAPRRSRNLSSVSHLRRPTTSARIIAMCAAGPPKAVPPSRRNNAASSASDVLAEIGLCRVGGGAVGAVVVLV